MQEINNIYFRKKNTINCRGKVLDLSEPAIMGVLNVTPDSFYDGGAHNSITGAMDRISEMIREGADIIDIGAVSTRPGADMLTEDEELKRLLPVLKLVSKEFPDTIFSSDTFRSNIARIVVSEYGVSIINDISAGAYDPMMLATVSELNVPYIIMHIKGTPENMQTAPEYNDLTGEIFRYFYEKVKFARDMGIKDIILDPGFGFAKTIDHNYQLLNGLDAYKIFELPVIIGISRKSMIFKLLENTPSECLNGSSVLNTISLLKGADIIRVHDVKEAVEAMKIIDKYNSCKI